jgi:hypothetical protein
VTGPGLLRAPVLRRRDDVERFDGERAHAPVDGCAGRCRFDPCPAAVYAAIYGPTADGARRRERRRKLAEGRLK